MESARNIKNDNKMDNRIEQICEFAYSFKKTVYYTYDTAVELMNLNGCFVECGVAGGAQIAAMQLALIENNIEKDIYAFDSFEGIPLAGEFDIEQPGIGKIEHDKKSPLEKRLISSGITCHSVEEVKGNFKRLHLPINNLHFIKGWFQHTLPSFKMPEISILRLDGDLYESTYVCLEHLYEKVISGGIVIIDDYALTGCREAVNQYFINNGLPFPDMYEINDGNGVVSFKKQTNN